VPGYDLRILDDEGHEVTPGTPGTLHVRGTSMATGYWSRYDATQHVFQGEWLCTGDTYVQDAEGCYACLGRTGDMIKASGMWVAPAEVETRLLQHPAVGQAAVVATVDADGLEKPVAYVVLAANADADADVTGEATLIEFCREGLPSFKRPRRVIFLDALPTTATGKVRRVELRAAAVGLLGGTTP
jgi:acyl-coenzyme A synthetase/AMP-(fatty) acid ligase